MPSNEVGQFYPSSADRADEANFGMNGAAPVLPRLPFLLAFHQVNAHRNDRPYRCQGYPYIYSTQATDAIKTTPPMVAATLAAPPVKVGDAGLAVVTVALEGGEAVAT